MILLEEKKITWIQRGKVRARTFCKNLFSYLAPKRQQLLWYQTAVVRLVPPFALHLSNIKNFLSEQ